MRFFLIFSLFLLPGCAHVKAPSKTTRTRSKILMVYSNDFWDIDYHDTKLLFYFERDQVLEELERIIKDTPENRGYLTWKKNLQEIKSPGFYSDHETFGTAEGKLLKALLKNQNGWMCCARNNKHVQTRPNIKIKRLGKSKFFVLKEPWHFSKNRKQEVRVGPYELH